MVVSVAPRPLPKVMAVIVAWSLVLPFAMRTAKTFVASVPKVAEAAVVASTRAGLPLVSASNLPLTIATETVPSGATA